MLETPNRAMKSLYRNTTSKKLLNTEKKNKNKIATTTEK